VYLNLVHRNLVSGTADDIIGQGTAAPRVSESGQEG